MNRRGLFGMLMPMVLAPAAALAAKLEPKPDLRQLVTQIDKDWGLGVGREISRRLGEPLGE